LSGDNWCRVASPGLLFNGLVRNAIGTFFCALLLAVVFQRFQQPGFGFHHSAGFGSDHIWSAGNQAPGGRQPYKIFRSFDIISKMGVFPFHVVHGFFGRVRFIIPDKGAFRFFHESNQVVYRCGQLFSGLCSVGESDSTPNEKAKDNH
jgi:hypothetical protein